MIPNDLGKVFLVEECQRIELSDLLKKCRRSIKEALLKSRLETLGVSFYLTTSNTGYGGERIWFECPQCRRRVGTLFLHPITNDAGCRLCLKLEYRKRRFKGMVELKEN